MVEIELYRRAAEATVGRKVCRVVAPDPWYLKRGLTEEVLKGALEGATIGSIGRRGKLLVVDLGERPVLGLRFGMTGRLVVDDRAAIGELEYGSSRDLPSWDRFALEFRGGGSLRVNDPRRLGGVELDPDVSAIGPDALDVGVAGLAKALGKGKQPLKARLMDQAHLAGVGNLLADEVLFRAGLDPRRPAGSLSPAEVRRLQRHLRGTVSELVDLGGSHRGRLQPHRVSGGRCPKDGTPLKKATIGGRTTYWCPLHQQ
jgi:formamidopyrimidine-DNA glycosylase